MADPVLNTLAEKLTGKPRAEMDYVGERENGEFVVLLKSGQKRVFTKIEADAARAALVPAPKPMGALKPAPVSAPEVPVVKAKVK